MADQSMGESLPVQCSEDITDGHPLPTQSGPTSNSSSSYEYNMNHPRRGLFIIINNKEFKKTTGMNARNGTDVDAANLYQRFKELGFEVHIFHNKTCLEMKKIAYEAARYEHHSNSDAFGCAILSHGDDGVVYGTDGIIKVEDLCAPFRGDRCKGLAGKPKLFFIQACRGNELDHGTEVADSESDDEDNKIHCIPAEADFFYAYSTVPGYFSWRNSTKGSWFVQAINTVFKEHSATHDLMWMMTRVNNIVAYDFESNASQAFMNHKKQISSVVTQLTRDVYLRPKTK